MQRKISSSLHCVCKIMSLDLDYRVVRVVDGEMESLVVPKRILRAFGESLDRGDEEETVRILEDARRKAGEASPFVVSGDCEVGEMVVPLVFEYVVDGKMPNGFKSYSITEETSCGSAKENTDVITKMLGAHMIKINGEDILSLDLPEQMEAKCTQDGDRNFVKLRFVDEPTRYSRGPKFTKWRKVRILSDLLFHFLVEGVQYEYRPLGISESKLRKERYGEVSHSANIDHRNKRKALRARV